MWLKLLGITKELFHMQGNWDELFQQKYVWGVKIYFVLELIILSVPIFRDKLIWIQKVIEDCEKETLRKVYAWSGLAKFILNLIKWMYFVVKRKLRLPVQDWQNRRMFAHLLLQEDQIFN